MADIGEGDGPVVLVSYSDNTNPAGSDHVATINSEGSVTYDTSRFDRISEDTLTDDVDLTDGGTYRKLIEDPDAPDDGEGARNEEGTSPSTQSHSSPNGTKKEKESGILGASFNVINSIVGAGMIGVPAALREAGFVTGVFLLVLVALVTDFTLYILVATGVSINRLSYQEAVKKALGVVGLVLVTIAQFFFPFFAMIGYIVIVGDTITRVISGACESAFPHNLYHFPPPPITFHHFLPPTTASHLLPLYHVWYAEVCTCPAGALVCHGSMLTVCFLTCVHSPVLSCLH
jgi:hypothetical protein